jgi:hypothetical protein
MTSETPNLPTLVYADCRKLLDPKYMWLEWYHRVPGPRPPFKLPADPTEDIAKVKAWKPVVEKESKGMDPGDDFRAVRFRDEGTNIYSYNYNTLKQQPECASPADVQLALERWEELHQACGLCRRMMHALHNNL